MTHLKNTNINISLATVYNNLNELADKGILRKFYVNNDRMWFDSNLQDHYHFYDSDKDELIDIDKNEISFSKSPKIPAGKKADFPVSSIDLFPTIMEVTGSIDGNSFTPLTAFYGGPYIAFFSVEIDCKETYWLDKIYRNGEV